MKLGEKTKKNIGERPLGVRVVKAPTLHWTSWRISVKCSCLKGGTRLICHFCWNFPWTASSFFIHFVYCHMFSRYSHAVPFKGCWESLISVSYPGRNTHTQTPSCHIETQADKHSHTGKIKILPSQKTVEVQHRWTRWRKRWKEDTRLCQ